MVAVAADAAGALVATGAAGIQADEVLAETLAVAAAIRAGYSAKTAEQQGPRLLGNVGVKAAIEAAQAERSKRVEVDADDVLREWLTIECSLLAFAADRPQIEAAALTETGCKNGGKPVPPGHRVPNRGTNRGTIE